MTEISNHYKYMEDLVGSKLLKSFIQCLQFQRIQHTADGIEQAAAEQQQKSRARKYLI